MTHSRQQRVVTEIRRQEERREDQLKHISQERRMQANLVNEESLEKKRYLRKMLDEQHEKKIDEALLKAEDARIHREKRLEQEERMAKELARISHEKLKDEKIRQHIKENSIELRELEVKLKSAYLNRERAAQIAEKEALRYESMRQDADLTLRARSEQERALAEDWRQAQRRHEELLCYQKVLEQQLAEKEHKRQEAYEEFLKEKLMVDEIVRKIYEEDQTQRQLRLEKITATQRYIEEFKVQQAEWRRMEQEKMEEENRRILDFAQYQQSKEEERMAKAREREDAKEHLHKMLTEKIELERQQHDEMERVREELYLEEQAEMTRQKQMEEMEKRIRQRLELQQTCRQQMALKQLRKQAESLEEEAFRQTMMAKFAEDDRIEQMNAQRRRMKQLEHRRAVEKLLEDRRQQFLADKELEAEERAMEQERVAVHRKIIEEERRKLLKLHATKLLGYLPKGIFREDDLDHFDEDFKRNFRSRETDVTSDKDWGDE